MQAPVAADGGEVVQVEHLHDVVADRLHHVRLVVVAVEGLGHVHPVEERRQDAEHGRDEGQKYDANLPEKKSSFVIGFQRLVNNRVCQKQQKQKQTNRMSMLWRVVSFFGACLSWGVGVGVDCLWII